MAEEVIEQEWVNDSDTVRRVRVYDVGGDFFLDIPSGARLTFGYFNPASPKWADTQGSPYQARPSEVARATALRIYADTTDKRQLACFLNVAGFKDDSIKLTKLVQRVTVETNLVNDGEGSVTFGAKQARKIRAIPETTGYQGDDDSPF